MAQDSNSISETLDSSLPSLPDDDRAGAVAVAVAVAVADHPQSSSSSSSSSSTDPPLTRNSSFSRLNAKAPEFVPRATSPSIPPSTHGGLIHMYPGPNSAFHVPIHGGGGGHVHPHHVQVQFHPHHHHPHRPQYQAVGFVDRQEVAAAVQAQQQHPAAVEADHVPLSWNDLSEEATQKLLNQVEYYFSDINLATTDHLMRFISKDAEGYVPIPVVASFKKVKAVISSNSQLASILRNSNKLVVSEDGKKVRRHHPLTESEMEELQSRIVVAENLPEDHCHQNLMKIFSAVGSVKTIRTCPPQISNGGVPSASRSGKADSMLFSNKLHAFVEYESVELAEKAVAEFNDQANWRSGLRVRLLLRRTVKSAQARGKRIDHEGNAYFEEDDTSTSEQTQPNEKNVEDPSQQSDAQSHEGEEHPNDKEGGQKKGRGRGRGKGRGRAPLYLVQHQNIRGSNAIGTPPSGNISPYHNSEHPPIIPKQPPGPRMPDGTRGFSMGRGKQITVNIAT